MGIGQRTRLLRATLLSLGGAAACATADPTRPPALEPSRGVEARAYRLVIAPHVLDTLAVLADTMRRETVRCLVGVMYPDSAVVELAWPPPIGVSTAHRVQYQTCPRATVAVWHNHLAGIAATPEDACYLSRTDIEEAVRQGAPPIQIVQVTRAVACWWSRRQILTARRDDQLRPMPGQLRGLREAPAATGRRAAAVGRRVG